jgi:hypothetical protein
MIPLILLCLPIFGGKVRLPFPERRATGNGGDDRDLIPFLQRSLQVLDEPNIFVIDIDVDESPHLALFIPEPLFKPGISVRQRSKHFSDCLPL